MKQYRERGGWLSVALTFIYAYMAYDTEYLFSGIVFSIVALGFFILHKLDRISNALNDLHNDREV